MAIWWNRAALLLPAAGLLLAGCDMLDPQYGIDMNAPTFVNPHKVRVMQDTAYQEVPAGQVTPALLASLASAHARQGGGPMDVVVTYPLSSPKAQAQGQAHADAIARDLRRAGSPDVRASALPAEGPALVTFSFSTYEAHAPENCDPMPGVDGLGTALDRDYPMGCAVSTALAKQIARPSDLLGRGADLPPGDGQRAGEIVGRHRTGEPNKPLEGEGASDQ